MKTVLITGANKGIGLETARQLGVKGWKVIISGRSSEKLQAASALLLKQKIECKILLMDVADDIEIEKAARSCAAQGIIFDVIINNAAVLLKTDNSLLSASSQQFQGDYTQTMKINAFGPLAVVRHFLPLMKRPGKIINISSQGGSLTDPVGGWAPIYCVSKSLLNAITRQLAFELRDQQISVNAVCPGWVQTDMGGAGAPRDVSKGAETPVWLASEEDVTETGSFFRDKAIIPW